MRVQIGISSVDAGTQLARVSRPARWETNGGSYNGLLHREERPAPERNIIDTSEWTRTNYRYVTGHHFGLSGRGASPLYERLG